MRILEKAFILKSYRRCTVLFSGFTLLILLLGLSVSAQDAVQSGNSTRADRFTTEKRKFLKMTELTFGGNGLLFTRIKNQNAILMGGRGSATFNERYTIGGGGWGMARGVELSGEAEGIYSFAKMGYGGVDFGYLIFPGEKMILGTKLLIAGGAVFKETIPGPGDKGFKLFPVLEPCLYYQVSLGKSLRLELGTSYRYIRGTNLQYISDKQLSGFSFYAGFLVRT